jgi:hypothetical protein
VEVPRQLKSFLGQGGAVAVEVACGNALVLFLIFWLIDAVAGLEHGIGDIAIRALLFACAGNLGGALARRYGRPPAA